ncbi:hypothetical protein AKO1_011425 [Acrasis kona]|uniref:F-box domain-containing protein n=1 Tax=Acrasis kona TaxID=1008807 RepID=A0AAW2ZLX8_9EUKA
MFQTRPKQKSSAPNGPSGVVQQAISPLHSHARPPSPYCSVSPRTSASSSKQLFAQSLEVYDNFKTSSSIHSNRLLMGSAQIQQMNFIPDIYLLIFSFLDHKDILLTIALTCRQWNNDYAKSEALWKELCMNVQYYREQRRRLHSSFHNAFSIVGDTSSPVSSFSLKEIKDTYRELARPPMEYKSWKTYYRYYSHWAGALTWDTTERGPNVKFQNQNLTVYRDDNITYHWQTVRSTTPIIIPTEKQKTGVMSALSGVSDDIAIYEWEIVINKFDKNHSNGWWVVIGLETEHFPYKESTPTNLVGYDRHMGWGYACGNGDALHCYSNVTLKNKQPFTCDPVTAWMNVPYGQGDVIRVRVKYFTKCCVDAIDPKENIGATLDYYVNDKWMGQAFRNITGVVYPAVSLLTNQAITLRHVDPIVSRMIQKKNDQLSEREVDSKLSIVSIGPQSKNKM